MDLLFRSAFFGFSLWTFIWAFGRSKVWGSYKTEDLDRAAVKIIILFGLISLAIMAFTYASLIFESDGLPLNLKFYDRYFGKHWFAYWILFSTYFFLPQLLWFEKLRLSRILRVVSAIWILMVLHIEKFVIIATSYEGDFSPKPGIDIWIGILFSWIMNGGIFVFMLIIGMKLKTMYKKIYTINGERNL